MSICKGCWREIDWIHTPAGKMMPFDPDPVFVIEGDGKDLFYTEEGEQLRGRPARPDEVATREAKFYTYEEIVNLLYIICPKGMIDRTDLPEDAVPPRSWKKETGDG